MRSADILASAEKLNYPDVCVCVCVELYNKQRLVRVGQRRIILDFFESQSRGFTNIAGRRKRLYYMDKNKTSLLKQLTFYFFIYIRFIFLNVVCTLNEPLVVMIYSINTQFYVHVIYHRATKVNFFFPHMENSTGA